MISTHYGWATGRVTQHASKPVMYTIGEHDALWLASQQFVDDFTAAFANASRVESSMLLYSLILSSILFKRWAG